ncbi:MAG: hypothetical protein ACP5UM_03450 [Anaerolineae bacterium]
MGTVKRAAWVLFVGGCAAVAVLVVKRVQPDALALLFGVVAGFLVSLPMGVLGFLFMARRARPPREGERGEGTTPPVIVITSGAAPQVWRQPGASDPQGAPGAPQGRRFTIGDWE